MKNVLTLFFVFYLSQSPAQTTFERIYQLPNSSEQAIDYCIASDGNYMIAGAHFDGSTEVAFLMKVDGLGNVLWRKHYSGLNGFHSIILTNDGGFAFTGYSEDLVQGDLDMFVLKTDGSGNVQWCNMFVSAGSTDFGLDVMQDQNGEYYLTGQGQIQNTNSMYIIKINAIGNIIWDKKVSASSAYISARHIISTSDGGVLITGSNEINNANGIFLMKIDLTGQVSWSRTYGNNFLGRVSYQTGDHGYITSGFSSSPNINRGFVLMKSDSTGNLQWCKVYSDGLYFPDLIINPDGDLIMAGAHQDGINDSANIYLVKTNPEGDTIWTRFYEIQNTIYAGESAEGILQTSDGGYLVGAKADNLLTQFPDIFLMKTDANGIAGCNQVFRQITINPVTPVYDTTIVISSGITTSSFVVTETTVQISDSTLCLFDLVRENNPQLQIEVYPNPVSNYLNIEIPFTTKGELNLEICDLMGRKMFAQKISSGITETIDVSLFSKGVYILRLIGKNESGTHYFCKQ